MQKLLATAAIAAIAGTASADITTVIFSITATNANGTGSYTFEIDPTQTSQGDFNWNLDEPITLTSEAGVEIATLNTAEVTTIADPVVSVAFNVFATQQQTSFQISSTVLSFPAISASNAVAQASAAVTLNDFGGGGAQFTPGPNGAYQAYFNNGNDLFASLFGSPLSVGNNEITNFSSDTGAFASPGFGVTSMSALWDFTLSPGDLATGTSVFEVIPAPASAVLLGIGGLAATRRRR